MGQFTEVVFSFPVGPYTALAVPAIIYWLGLALGAVNLEGSEMTAEAAGLEGAGTDVGRWGASRGFENRGAFERLGFAGVPNLIAATFLILWGWLFSFAGFGYLVLVARASPESVSMLVKIGIAVGAFLLAVVPARITVKPIAPLFLVQHGRTKGSLVGRTCEVLSGRVDETQGRANFNDGGAGLLLNIRCEKSNRFRKGSTALLTEYDAEKDVFRVSDSRDENEEGD